MTWLAKFQAIPFKAEGRDFRGCDCWGLHRLIVLERMGIELALWDTVPTDAVAQVEAVLAGERKGPSWREIERSDACECDVALMSRAGQIAHIGTCLGQGRLIHTERPVGPAVLDFDHWSIKNRIEGFVRYAG